ncbi:hypothetical protein EJ05DRAFT_71915 [Pseudovirgaria hyperparasitica]|uniref:Uncharacterized protein n=1 Tax=Pseudovirgaria hyperparasitica TaxID=470096 RepID=A0A6A6W3Y6_9PEZI|nr:uncharacterized protein EJ05DRAFT_71915 [Pseudovirgaria hyperparasitica]KAF2756660.1 hypothetical protein EJ05DRAFT_71915 [Pseudovirgaria hyperparasitica]
MASSPPPRRRFIPEPFETTTASSRRPPYRVDDDLKATKRFAPEHIETTVKSSRKLSTAGSETPPKARRRFAPEPVEMSSKSNRKPPQDGALSTQQECDPEPETTTRPNRETAHTSDTDRSNSSSRSLSGTDQSSTDGSPKRPRRKFAPQLIETSKRTRKAGDDQPAVLPSDRTEAVTMLHLAIPKHMRPETDPEPPVNTPTGLREDESIDEVLEARRLGKAIPARSASRSSNRSHSFRVPELDTIESSQSEDSNPPSLSTSPSSDKPYLYKHATRIRESVDDRYSGYLLQIAARAAEKQLRDQAMAAFPNNDFHEPVQHYIDRDSDEYVTRDQDRESSYTQVNWDLREMQEFRKKLSQNNFQDKKVTAKTGSKVQEATRGPWGNPSLALGRPPPRNKENDGVPARTRPPMLGEDISFPRCNSPEPARFDVTQGCFKVKESMCYLTEQSQHMEDKGKEGLWASKPSNIKRLPSDASHSTTTSSGAGLWGGCCVAPATTPTRGNSGLMTPSIGVQTPIQTPCSTPFRSSFSPSGPQDYFSSVHEKLELEQTIEEEFNDAFVTQVYNYLSLGYPSIAREFDDELSKIARIEVHELRHDDELVKDRGYIRFGDEEHSADVSEDSCMRWKALRTYIREWAKQQPRMVSGAHALGGFGVGARRGSWAI